MALYCVSLFVDHALYFRVHLFVFWFSILNLILNKRAWWLNSSFMKHPFCNTYCCIIIKWSQGFACQRPILSAWWNLHISVIKWVMFNHFLWKSQQLTNVWKGLPPDGWNFQIIQDLFAVLTWKIWVNYEVSAGNFSRGELNSLTWDWLIFTVPILNQSVFWLFLPCKFS